MNAVITGEMSKSERRKLLGSLPVDLRQRVTSRFFTLEQAQAWVRLREAFGGDVDALRETLLTAYAVPEHMRCG